MLLAFLVGVLLGTVPMAWIVVRLRARQDVSAMGSGNVGAFNALRVSRSPWVGVLVMLLDAGKGVLAVWLATRLGLGGELLHRQCAALVGVVAGHNYNPWLTIARRRLTGGKGFAAAAGALLAFRPWIVPCWLGIGLLAWIVLRVTRGMRDEAPASLVATVLVVPLAWWLYDSPTTIAAGAVLLLAGPKLIGEVRGLLRTKPDAG